MKKTNGQNMYSNHSSNQGNSGRTKLQMANKMEYEGAGAHSQIQNIVSTYQSANINKLSSDKKSTASKVRLGNNSQNRASKNASKSQQSRNYVSAQQLQIANKLINSSNV